MISSPQRALIVGGGTSVERHQKQQGIISTHLLQKVK